MSRIFISHSSTDNAKTRAILAWIVSQGWAREEIFVDFDDIGGGQRWREALTKAASRCEAVVFLISPEWVRRPWCTGEAGAAQMLGRQIIPVLIEPTPPEAYRDLLTVEYQLIDLTVPGPRCVIDVLMPDTGQTLPVALAESGLQRLVVGLKRAGLDPSTFPLTPGRKIYPGLAPLDTGDAAVFFGRDGDIARGIETLRQMRERGQSLLAILAASGAGKSSFLRAGLWPRLQRADREFLILPVLRPGVDALNGEQGLVAGLHRAGETLGLKRNLADWRAQIESGDFAGALTVLHAAARARMLAVDAAQPASASQTPASQRHASLPPIPVLPIDQAEELFGAQGGEHARRLLDLLATALREGRLIAVLAIRSDRYGDLQTAQALAGLEQRPFSLPPIADGVLKDVIEGPAQRDRQEYGANGLNIDPQLTDRLLRDWADADGLPLLAFTLRRLLDDYGSDGRLNLEDYERSGQLQGALDAAIGRAMQGATAAGTLPEDAQKREDLIRSTFVPWLVSVDPQSQQPQRRIAKRNALPAASQDLIGRLIDARLLTCDRPQDHDASVEVAHEAILRHWPLLDRIVGQEREALIVLNEVKRDAEVWQASKKSDDGLESDDALLHRGDRLRHAEQHLAREDFQSALGDDGRRYLAACRAREAQEIEDERLQQEREAKQIARTRKMQRRTTVLLASVVVVIVIAGVFLMRLQQTTNQTSADVLASLASQAFDRHEYDRAVRFALAGLRKRDVTVFEINARKAETQLLRAGYRSSLRAKLTFGTGEDYSGLSPDGRKLITVSGKLARITDTETGQVLVTMKHNKLVSSAAFSPDGRRVVTASADNTTRLWDAETGRTVASMALDGPFESAAFSPDGSKIVTTSFDGIPHLWDANSGRLLATMAHDGVVRSVDFSPDGRKIITVLSPVRPLGDANSGQTAHAWDADSGRLLTTMKHNQNISFAAFSPNSRIIVITSGDTMTDSDHSVHLWDADSGRLLAALPHDHYVRSAVFSHDGHRFLTAAGNKVLLWEANSGRLLATALHDAAVNGADVNGAGFSSDGHKIVSTAGHTLHVWDTDSGQRIAMLHDGPITTADFSPDGHTVVTASLDNTARLWDTTSGRLLDTMQHNDWVSNAAFSNDGSRIVTHSAVGRTVRTWKVNSNHLLHTMPHDGPVNSAVFSNGGDFVLTASDDKTARLWNTDSGRALATLTHEHEVSRAFFNYDSQRIITVSGRAARTWSTDSGQLLATMMHDDWAQSASSSSDGHRIITIGSTLERNNLYSRNFAKDRTARLWDADTGRLVVNMKHKDRRENDWVRTAVFSPDGRRVITASGKTIRLWDADTGQLLTKMTHNGEVNSANFSPDSGLIVSASSDNTARIWDAVSGQLLATLMHDTSVFDAIFDQNRRRILTSADKTMRIWDVDSGDLLATMPYLEGVRRAIFSPYGRRVFALSSGGGAELWDTDVYQPIIGLSMSNGIFDAQFSIDGGIVITRNRKQVNLHDSASGDLLASVIHPAEITSATFSPDSTQLVTTSTDGSARIWDTALFKLRGQALINVICRDILNVDVNAPPRDNDLSRFSYEELRMAAVIDPETERDVCRPHTRLQRFASMFGIGG